MCVCVYNIGVFWLNDWMHWVF